MRGRGDSWKKSRPLGFFRSVIRDYWKELTVGIDRFRGGGDGRGTARLFKSEKIFQSCPSSVKITKRNEKPNVATVKGERGRGEGQASSGASKDGLGHDQVIQQEARIKKDLEAPHPEPPYTTLLMEKLFEFPFKKGIQREEKIKWVILGKGGDTH